ncbi:MAG: hypothetical protein Q7T03_01035 [Deltaproteobacteria bacterium]|nr:hypothetical protein [Deltaproteobacteria bacterium]
MENSPQEGKKMQMLRNVVTWLFIIAVGVPSLIGLTKKVWQWTHPGHTQNVAITYLQQIGPLAEKTGVILNEMAPLFQNAANTPKEKLVAKVIQSREQLMEVNKEALAISPPQEMQQINRQFLDSLDNYVKAFQLAERGIQNDSDAEINQSAELLIKGSNQMKSVSEESLKMAE